MDASPINSACTALVGSVSKTSSRVISFVRVHREAKADLTAVHNELSELRMVLELLMEDCSARGEAEVSPSLKTLVVPIVTNCSTAVSKLDKVLKSLDGGADSSDYSEWTITAAAEVSGLCNTLEAHRGSLNLALELLSVTVSSPGAVAAAMDRDGGILAGELDPSAQIAAELARSQAAFVNSDKSAADQNFMLSRFLDNLSSYAETVTDYDAWDEPGEAIVSRPDLLASVRSKQSLYRLNEEQDTVPSNTPEPALSRVPSPKLPRSRNPSPKPLKSRNESPKPPKQRQAPVRPTFSRNNSSTSSYYERTVVGDDSPRQSRRPTSDPLSSVGALGSASASQWTIGGDTASILTNEPRQANVLRRKRLVKDLERLDMNGDAPRPVRPGLNRLSSQNSVFSVMTDGHGDIRSNPSGPQSQRASFEGPGDERPDILGDVSVSPTVADSISEKRKLMIVGDTSCGKTSLILSFAEGTYSEVNTPTVFESYSAGVKAFGAKLKLDIWDFGGAMDNSELPRTQYYGGANAFLVCFDIGNPSSLESVREKWKPEVTSTCPGVPLILVGLGRDRRQDEATIKKLQAVGEHPVTKEEGEDAREMIGASQYLECSAKTNDGVTEVFEWAAKAAASYPTRPKKKWRLSRLLGSSRS